jgi:hypothetical protein
MSAYNIFESDIFHISGLTPYSKTAVTLCFHMTHKDATPIMQDENGQWRVMMEAHGRDILLSIVPKEMRIAFIGKDNHSTQAQLIRVEPYANGAKAAVVISADDWDEKPHNHATFQKAAQACQKRGLWLTAAIVSGSISEEGWRDIGELFADGHIEVASHSLTHPGKAPYKEKLMQELVESRKILFERIPGCDVACWVEPSGYLDRSVAKNLVRASYLVSRSTQQGRMGFCEYTLYDCFLRAGITAMLEEYTLEHANDVFDRCVKTQGIYHAAMHPRMLDWSGEGWIYKHLDHISGRDDIWYTSLGELYRYRYNATQALKITRAGKILHQPASNWQRFLATLLVNLRMQLDSAHILWRRYLNQGTPKDRVARYMRWQMHCIPGWFAPPDTKLWQHLLDEQSKCIKGSLAEIGIHHGRSFMPLAMARKEGEKALAVDFFMDTPGYWPHRERNFHRHLARHQLRLCEEEIFKGNSKELSAEDIRKRVGELRFFHIDGGHGYKDVRSDLQLASKVLSPQGIIVLDDFMNPSHPEVGFSAYDWLKENTDFAPFAVTPSKLYITRAENVELYQKILTLTPYKQISILQYRLPLFSASLPTRALNRFLSLLRNGF